MAFLSFLLGSLFTLVMIPLVLFAFLFILPIHSQTGRFYLSRKHPPKVTEPPDATAEVETARWVSELLNPIFRVMSGRKYPKAILRNAFKDFLTGFHQSSAVRLLNDPVVSQVDLGSVLPKIRSVLPLKGAQQDGITRFLLDLDYPGGIEWVLDGDLMAGVKLPISMLIKVVSLYGKVLIEIPQDGNHDNEDQTDSPAMVKYSFMVGPEIELSVDTMYRGKLLPHVGKILAALFASSFKANTQWPNKRELFDLSLPAASAAGSTTISQALYAAATTSASPASAGQTLVLGDQETLGQEVMESPASEKLPEFNGELESMAHASQSPQMVSLYVQGPTRSHTKLISGTAGTDVKDFLKMAEFSFGIDPRDADKYELVARQGVGTMVVDVKRFPTIKRIQSHLESHEHSILQLRKKSGGGGSFDKKNEHHTEALAKEDSSPNVRQNKIMQRKRSNSIV